MWARPRRWTCSSSRSSTAPSPTGSPSHPEPSIGDTPPKEHPIVVDDKILSRDRLVALHGRPREGRLVFTNGCFDLLHPGHVAYLEAARALGDLLVVGLNTDASVHRLKGATRPLVPQDDRARVVAGLAAVDAVTLFGEDTPAELIAALRPDVLVKGGDYDLDAIVGRHAVEADGGEVRVIPFLPGYSTTDLVRRIRQRTEES